MPIFDQSDVFSRHIIFIFRVSAGLFTLMLLFTLIACPGGTPASSMSENCSTLGQRCQISPGVLGVCSPTTSDEASPQTRLQCTPQH